jgi:hypothetical protein
MATQIGNYGLCVEFGVLEPLWLEPRGQLMLFCSCSPLLLLLLLGVLQLLFRTPRHFVKVHLQSYI